MHIYTYINQCMYIYRVWSAIEYIFCSRIPTVEPFSIIRLSIVIDVKRNTTWHALLLSFNMCSVEYVQWKSPRGVGLKIKFESDEKSTVSNSSPHLPSKSIRSEEQRHMLYQKVPLPWKIELYSRFVRRRIAFRRISFVSSSRYWISS